jgi:chromosome segregation ATPase
MRPRGLLLASIHAASARRSGVGIALVVAWIAMSIAGAARAETFKWVDDKGVVHYTDKMPADQVNKAATVLDTQARPIKKIDPPPTAAQRAAKESEERRVAAMAKEREEADRHDRALMQSFTSPEEIALSKSRAIATIDSQLQSSHAYIAQLTSRRADVEAKKTSYGNKPVPDSLEREIVSIDAEVQRQKELVEARKVEKAQTAARYDAFATRWRELKAEADAKALGGSSAAAGSTAATAKAQNR